MYPGARLLVRLYTVKAIQDGDGLAQEPPLIKGWPEMASLAERKATVVNHEK